MQTTNQPAAAEAAEPVIYVAGAVIDGDAVMASPGAVAVAGGRVLAAGGAAEVIRSVGGDTQLLPMPDFLLIPALVNAHCHLDLTAIGPQPYPGSFINWVRMVMERRPADPQAIGTSVEQGVELSRIAGVGPIGDIAGSADALRATGGVSFLEVIGHNLIDPPAIPADEGGLQPHAPYSTGPAAYAACASAGCPVTTHLAETIDEVEFVRSATGPFRDLLDRMGKWDSVDPTAYGQGLHPIDWLDQYGRRDGSPVPWLCAHCNYIEDAHLALMADADWSVAYCPRASDYFGHSGHRYRDMLGAGLNVALGTDSIICHGTLSILDEMRHVHRRDGTDPRTLLRMATINGARALGLDPATSTFQPGAPAGLVAIRYDSGLGISPLKAVLRSDQVPRELVRPV
jgi:cytosine/adenosine deaminase-related metal-dependent hydrolase